MGRAGSREFGDYLWASSRLSPPRALRYTKDSFFVFMLVESPPTFE
jgi:hypothetical protein